MQKNKPPRVLEHPKTATGEADMEPRFASIIPRNGGFFNEKFQTGRSAFCSVPGGHGADCCFTYDGIQLPVLGGIAPGDTVFVHRTNVTQKNGPVAVQFDGENVLCLRSETDLGDLYSPLDPRTPGRFLTDQDGETVLIGEVVGLTRYFSRLTEVQNNEI